jgi:FAD/FMN-containing dehydrogenase
MNAPSSLLIDRFAAIVGPAHAIRDPGEMAPYLVEQRGLFTGRAAAVLKPANTAEVAAILKLANETGTAVVPQGGNTGLVGGQTPDDSGKAIIVSLSRLNRIRKVDAAGYTMTVEAGVTLAEAQGAADAAVRLFPLSLASEGTCQIGGNLSTNAGGTAVLAYGNARALALGLEVVLASGEVWDGLRTLRKDNTGYDLRDLFIGAEGTLGIITAAVLKLFPRPKGTSVAWVGLASPKDALALLGIAKARAGGGLTAFELMPRIGLEFLLKHLPGARDPLAQPHPWYVLMEAASGTSQEDAEATVEAIFADGVTAGAVSDGARAESLDQAAAFWRLRHAMSDIQKAEGGSIKHDISVPVASVPTFIDEAGAAVMRLMPDARLVPFGHLGDGNLHFNVTQPTGADKQAFLSHWEEMNAAVHAVVARYGGSISAEHGIGQLKRHLLTDVKSPVEIATMRKLKATLDPNGIMNPGKVL